MSFVFVDIGACREAIVALCGLPSNIWYVTKDSQTSDVPIMDDIKHNTYASIKGDNNFDAMAVAKTLFSSLS